MHSGNRKKVGIVGSVGIPAKYGGFETLAEHLVQLLSQDIDLHVVCSSKSYPEKIKEYRGAKLYYVPLSANGIQSIPYDIWSILKISRRCDTILILGVASGFFLPIFKLFSKKRLVLNVDGLEWKREKWGKIARWYLRNAERFAVRSADLVIADNKVIQQHLYNSYRVASILIEYGADHVSHQSIEPTLFEQFPFLSKPYAFKVCRIEPENNIHMILEAFSLHDSLDLVIIGNWKKNEYGQRLRKQYDASHIHLLDPIYDQNLLDQFRSNCRVYVHGHSAGGTNPSLVEAMYLGLPIIAFDVDYNRETTENLALGYFKNPEEILQILNSNNTTVMKVCGEQMKSIANSRYTWFGITKKYKSAF